MPEMIVTTGSDTARIRFSVRDHPTTYGDGRVFYDYLIVMRIDGIIVGVYEGPSREFAEKDAARKAAWRRISELKRHRLYAVAISAKNIEDGEARSCNSCAIAQSLWDKQKEMGLDTWEYDFRVEPYGFAVDVDGIVLAQQSHPYTTIATGESQMPDLVSIDRRGKLYIESMYEWACGWDEWADSRHMTLREWREEHGYSDGERPYKPTPCAFVLDLDAMEEPHA